MVFWQTSTNAFHTFLSVDAFSCARVVFCNILVWQHCMCPPPQTDHAQSTYRVSADGSFLVTLASGMELSLSTEPLLLGGFGGGVSPTASRCNISLPGDHAPSLIEWRQRKEQSKTNYSTYERRLRVKKKKKSTRSALITPDCEIKHSVQMFHLRNSSAAEWYYGNTWMRVISSPKPQQRSAVD